MSHTMNKYLKLVISSPFSVENADPEFTQDRHPIMQCEGVQCGRMRQLPKQPLALWHSSLQKVHPKTQTTAV